MGFACEKTIDLIKSINSNIPNVKFVCLATSFPKNISELGNIEEGNFALDEIKLWNNLNELLGRSNQFGYGDYGSINPIRQDLIRRGGWHARIAYPSSEGITYIGQKQDKIAGYAKQYQKVANDLKNSGELDLTLDSWGVEQIIEAADGKVPKKIPSFWTSVRMENHIQQQLKRLGFIQRPTP